MAIKKPIFGFSVLNSANRPQQDDEMQGVFAMGSFPYIKLSSAVTTILDLRSGDYAMILSTVSEVDNAINSRSEYYMDFCKSNDYEPDDEEAALAFKKTNYVFGVAKGINYKNSDGNIQTVNERLSKLDKVAFIEKNFELVLNSALETASPSIQRALTREGVSYDEQVQILAQTVSGKELPRYFGRKTYSKTGLRSLGTVLFFGDTIYWKTLRLGMKEGKKTRIIRHYEAYTDNLQYASIFDGYEDVTVPYVMLGPYRDYVHIPGVGNKYLDTSTIK